MVDRIPPHSSSAERAVIGSMIRDNACIHEVFELITPESFYIDAHILCAKAISDFALAGRTIDLVTLAEELKQRNQIELIGYPLLLECFEDAPTSANAVYFAGVVREKHILRQLIAEAHETLREVYNPSGSAEDLLSDAQRRFLAIGMASRKSDNYPIKEAIREASDDIDRRATTKGQSCGVLSGLIDLDRLTGGFHPGEFCIIAARPSVGKTSLAVQLCQNAAESGHAALIFSLEQSRIELATRMLCGRSRVNSHFVRQGRLAKEQVTRLMSAGSELSQLPMWINDTAVQSVRNIVSASRRLMSKEKIRIIMIDYLQLVDSEDKRVNRVEQISQMTRSFKILARELNVPLVCLSQLSRASEQREEKTPRLSDLRDSGSIEQDADTVIFLHRPVRSQNDTEVIKAVVAKQRNGPTETIPLIFVKPSMRFENYSPGTGDE